MARAEALTVKKHLVLTPSQSNKLARLASKADRSEAWIIRKLIEDAEEN